MLSHVHSLLRTVFRRSEWEREMNEELRFHIEQRAAHLARSGMPKTEALRRARLEFGGLEAYKERCREASGAGWIDELARNLRYAFRSMRKNPGFTTVAVVSLALGIGANTAIFGLVKNLMLSPLPVRDPGGLRLVVRSTARGPAYVHSYAAFEALRDNFPIFSSLFAWSSSSPRVAAGEFTQTAHVMFVTGNYFDALGVRPAWGRLIAPEDDRAGGAADVAVLSYRAWKRFFAGNPALTRTIRIGKDGYRIIGVTPPEFLGTEIANPPAIYVPLQSAAQHFAPWLRIKGMLGLRLMGRLKSGVSLSAAQNALREGWPRLGQNPKRNPADHSRPEYLYLTDASNGYSGVRNQYSGAVLILMGLVAVVFLIACANLATLLFVRGAGRAGETSIRVALGATRAQLIRQWMTEFLCLALLAGVAGLLVARWINGVLLYFVPKPDWAHLAFHTDPKVLAFTAALTVAAGLLFGLVPAVRASRVNTDSAMRRYSPSVIGRGRVSQWLLAGQMAACLVLVTGAILFARTLWNLNTSAIGFDRTAVVYANPHASSQHPPARIKAAEEQIVAALARSPEIDSVSMGLPPILVGGTLSGWAVVPGHVYAPGENNTVYFSAANPGYFRTLSIPIVAGRDFEERDRPSAPNPSRVMIVNESFARHYFAGQNPIGQVVTIANSTAPGTPAAPREIVGMVKDSKRDSLREAQKDLAYFPVPLGGFPQVIVARGKPGTPPSVSETELRSAFANLAEGVPVETGQLGGIIQKSLSRDRMVTELSAAFGLLGLVLATIGLYGAMAHSVASRTREIGIRIALGADARQVLRMVLRESLTVSGVGILVGLPAAVAGSRVLGNLLFGVSPGDPLTMAASALLLATVGVLAGLRPARRAAGLDPARALRYE